VVWWAGAYAWGLGGFGVSGNLLVDLSSQSHRAKQLACVWKVGNVRTTSVCQLARRGPFASRRHSRRGTRRGRGAGALHTFDPRTDRERCFCAASASASI
jgi:hypothetical protein